MSAPLIALTGATGLHRPPPAAGAAEARLPRAAFCCAGPTTLPPEATGAVVGDLARPQNMSAALRGVDAVIHSAGVAHAMSGVPEDDYRAINTEATVGARPRRRTGRRQAVRVPLLDPRPVRPGVRRAS